MDQYIRGIIPRLKTLSKNVNKTELFVDKTWLLHGKVNRYTEFTFLRDKSVVKSINGIASTGTWRLLPTGKLLVNIDEEHLQLEPMFLNEGLFVLNISGDKNNGFIFFNEDVLKKMSLKNYLEGLVKKLESKENQNFITETEEEANSWSLTFAAGAVVFFFLTMLIVFYWKTL